MKQNFSKAEEALANRLKQMEVDHLNKLAEIAQRVGKPELRNMIEKAALAANKTALERKAVFHFVKEGLKKYKEPVVFTAVGTTLDEVQKVVQQTEPLSNEQWQLLTKVKESMQSAKQRYLQGHPGINDNQIVEKERKKHINKRFNVNEKWLPLQ